MKTSMLFFFLLVSGAVFAKTPATSAVNKLIANGTHLGNSSGSSCEVSVTTAKNMATITVSTNGASEAFFLLNSSLNYTVNETTGEISATQTDSSGKTQILKIKPVTTGELNFRISTILFDHRGNDVSSSISCQISR